MSFKAETLKRGMTVADGGWSTQLHARGVPTERPAELANLTHGEVVVALGREYVEAGARFLTTNTFGANRLMFEKRRVDADVAEVNRLGARLARQAVGEIEVVVVGSIGPSGKILAVGEVSEEQLVPVFAEQAQALAAGGADALVLETFSELAEILIALKAVKDATGLPVIASMSFDSGAQRTRTMMGAPADDCAAALDDAGADLVGCNCGAGINTFLPAVVALRASTELPLWVKPNAGLPELEDGRTVWKQTPEEFAAYVPELLDAGANVIGGCCGSGPAHIRRVAALVQSRRRRKPAPDAPPTQ